MIQHTVIDAAGLPYSRELHFAGAICALTTNSGKLGETLKTWNLNKPRDCSRRFSMQVVVTGKTVKNFISPHFRGLHHFVVASFGAPNTFVFDLMRRNVFATVSSELANDRLFWDRLNSTLT